jgi:hypothetical protein
MLYFFYKTRRLRRFIEEKITNLSYFIEGEGDRIGCKSANSFLNLILFLFEDIFLSYYFLPRQEVCARLLNEKFPILTKEMIKGNRQVNYFSINPFTVKCEHSSI